MVSSFTPCMHMTMLYTVLNICVVSSFISCMHMIMFYTVLNISGDFYNQNFILCKKMSQAESSWMVCTWGLESLWKRAHGTDVDFNSIGTGTYHDIVSFIYFHYTCYNLCCKYFS